MRAKLIGMKRTSFTAKESGEVINGVNIYVTYPDEKADGLVAERFFVKPGIVACAECKPGEEVRLYFNKYGKVEEIEVL